MKISVTDETQKLWSRTDMEGECWTFQGGLNKAGYGCVWINGKTRYVHRMVWESTRGPIPEGLVIDHICGNRACVRGGHMRLATRGGNAAHQTKLNIRNKTGYRGVFWDKRLNKYTATVGRSRLGYYTDLTEAAQAVKIERLARYGEMAGVN